MFGSKPKKSRSAVRDVDVEKMARSNQVRRHTELPGSFLFLHLYLPLSVFASSSFSSSSYRHQLQLLCRDDYVDVLMLKHSCDKYNTDLVGDMAAVHDLIW